MIIGLAGSFGAGKGAVAEYLIGKHGFSNYSIRASIAEEVGRRNLPGSRDSMIAVANDLRRAHGPAFLVENLFKQVEGFGGNIVIESLRNIAEVHKVKELGGHVIGVDAEPHIRYERVQKRGLAKDQLSFEGWIAQEAAESHPDDPMQQDIFGALRESDVVIQNDGTVEDLHQKIDAAIATFAETPNAQP